MHAQTEQVCAHADVYLTFALFNASNAVFCLLIDDFQCLLFQKEYLDNISAFLFRDVAWQLTQVHAQM